MNVQVNPEHYNDLDYNEKGRFCSYWHQVNGIINLNVKNVLEIGTGNGFVKFILEKYGVKVSTIDIDSNLNPDILGSVVAMPIADQVFDAALCCQVLEHLPYENFVPALREIRRVVKKNLILSLPDLNRIYRIGIQIPFFGEFKTLYTIPRLKPLKWEFNGEHYWNISCEHYPLSRIKSDIEVAGFEIVETFNVYEMSWHRFFVLKKNEQDSLSATR